MTQRTAGGKEAGGSREFGWGRASRRCDKGWPFEPPAFAAGQQRGRALAAGGAARARRAAAMAGLIGSMAAVTACGAPESGLPGEARPLFREAAVETGLDFRHSNGSSGAYYLPEIMAPGVALLDHDLDGDLDVYFLQGRPLGAGAIPVGLPPGNRLYENRLVPDGRLAFVDSTQGSGLGTEAYSMGVAVGDYDGDRDPDIYLTNLGPNTLLRNNGDGSFEAVDGPQDSRWSTSAAFLDYDADGDLDLFFANFVDFSVANSKECFAPTGERDYCLPTVYNPVPDRLFRNDGGTFADVTTEAGLAAAFGNGLGVAATDLDGDGLTDIYVANDTTPNQLWINSGNGRFENTAMLAGAAVNGDGRVEAGMGVAVADFDSDGDEDLLVTHNFQETNTLYLNAGGGRFTDSTNRLGMGAPSLPYTGFGVAWKDFDQDGELDAFIANGAVAIMEDQRGGHFPFAQENQFFWGRDGTLNAVEGAEIWGQVESRVSRGLATGDLDLDGDTDVVVTNCNGPARLYLNQSDSGAWIRVKLEGRGANRFGIGARVGLCAEDGSCAWRRVRRDGSYLSSNEAAAQFAGHDSGEAAYLEVDWPAGGRERFPVPVTAGVVTVREGEGTLR